MALMPFAGERLFWPVAAVLQHCAKKKSPASPDWVKPKKKSPAALANAPAPSGARVGTHGTHSFELRALFNSGESICA